MVSRIIRIVNKEISGLHEAAYLLAFFAILSQLLALVRDKLLANAFGAGNVLDIYYAAFRLPDLLYVCVVSIVSATVIMPFLIEKFEVGESEGKNFANQVFSFFFLMLVISSLLCFAFAPSLMRYFFRGFEEGKMELLITATRILLLSPIFLGISNFFGSLTQMKKRFVVYAISPLVYNIGIIIGIVFLYPTLGVKGLFWGVILGALLHMSIQIPLIYGSGLLPKFTLSLKVSEIWKVIKVSIPRTLTISSTQISSFFLVSMASLFQSGSVAVFNLGLNLQSVPLTIVGVSYSSAVFPVLSKYFVEKNKESFLARMIESTKHIIFWSFPITILFVVLRAQIVRTIYGAGNFDWSDTRLTAAALAIFILSSAAQCLMLLFVRSYYAEGRTKVPFFYNLFSSALTIALAYFALILFNAFPVLLYFLEEIFKVSGEEGTKVLILPLAYSVGVIINLILHWVQFERDYRGFTRNVLRSVFQIFSASIIMGYVTFISLRFFDNLFSLEKAIGVFMQGLLSGVTGIVAFLIVLKLLRNVEIAEMWKALHHRIWKSKIVVPDQEAL